MTRSSENFVETCHEEALVEDAKHYFNRDNPSVAKIDETTVDISFDDYDQEYLSPVVSVPFLFSSISCLKENFHQRLPEFSLKPPVIAFTYVVPMYLPLTVPVRANRSTPFR